MARLLARSLARLCLSPSLVCAKVHSSACSIDSQTADCVPEPSERQLWALRLGKADEWRQKEQQLIDQAEQRCAAAHLLGAQIWPCRRLGCATRFAPPKPSGAQSSISAQHRATTRARAMRAARWLAGWRHFALARHLATLIIRPNVRRPSIQSANSNQNKRLWARARARGATFGTRARTFC